MVINFMNIDIRGVIVNNFKNDSSKEMVDTINESLKSSDEQFFANVPDAIVYKGTICNKDYKRYLNK